MSSRDFGFIAWWCLQCFYIVTGAGMIVYSAGSYQAAANFEYKAVSTVGNISRTIAKTTYSQSFYSSIPHTSYVSTIQFKTSQGKLIAFTVRKACHVNDNPYACDGKEIQVFYDPDDPQLAMIKGGSSPLDGVMTTFWYGLFFVVVGIVSIHEAR
ncbi:DUF3592 domain-containing protein [Cyanobacteria bacterium FACHB-63]|nr:DUF3592 domain-containing protein [Cyanobacteria bacterium FACHB-63]